MQHYRTNKNRHCSPAYIIGVLLFLAMSGCGTLFHRKNMDQRTDSTLSDSSSSGNSIDPMNPGRSGSSAKNGTVESGVEIEYFLGRDHYRFHALSFGNSVTATSFLNRQILEKGEIDLTRYPDFLQKAADFIRHSHQAPLSASPCRSPFTVTVRIKGQTETTRGCRSADDGGLSKLVRDGEFLLYSKN